MPTLLISYYFSRVGDTESKKIATIITYLVLMVGTSKLKLLVGKESLDLARWKSFFELAALKVEVAVKTSEMKFQPLLTTFPELVSGLDFSESADSVEFRRLW